MPRIHGVPLVPACSPVRSQCVPGLHTCTTRRFTQGIRGGPGVRMCSTESASRCIAMALMDFTLVCVEPTLFTHAPLQCAVPSRDGARRHTPRQWRWVSSSDGVGHAFVGRSHQPHPLLQGTLQLGPHPGWDDLESQRLLQATRMRCDETLSFQLQ